jgi:hypothetical protein
MDTDAQVVQYFAGIWAHLDEHARRLVAASKAIELGYGGLSRVSRACCCLSRVTLNKGVEKLQAAPGRKDSARVRGFVTRARVANIGEIASSELTITD